MSPSVFLIVFIMFPFSAHDAYEESSNCNQGLPVLQQTSVALSSNQRDKSASLKCFNGIRAIRIPKQLQLLRMRRADWNYHSSFFGKLAHETLGNSGSRGGNYNRVEWREFPQTMTAITYKDSHIAITKLRENCLGAARQRGISLNRKYRSCEDRQERGLISGTGTNFEHGLAPGKSQRL